MKKLITVLLFFVSTLSLCAQSMGDRYYTDTISVAGKENYRILKNTLEQTVAPKYKLYKTQNMWTFIELNTCNGEIYKVQWTLNSREHERFTKYIGHADNMGNVPYKDYYPGRFELYETTNTYNFILLDTYSGKTWQVQWGMKEEENFVIAID